MEAFLAQYGRWLWLAGSLLGALLVDFACVRMLLDVVKPASVYAFWVGRAGKLAAILAWLLFFNGYWYPEYVGRQLGDEMKLAQVAIVVAYIAAALITMPRFGGRRSHDA